MKTLIIFLLLTAFISCSSPKEKETASIRDALNNYLTIKHKQSRSTATIDSFRIIQIDSISSKEDLATRITDLQYSVDYLSILSKPVSDLQQQMDSLKRIYDNNKADSADFIYYGVMYRLCYSNRKKEHNCKDSLYLRITKDFKIKI